MHQDARYPVADFCLTTHRGGGKVFRIVDDTKDLSQWEKWQPLTLWLCPPEMMITIISPDNQRRMRKCDSRTPALEIVADMCNQIFHLKDDIAYALYPDPDDMYRPIEMNKAICEVNPNMKELYLQRRFWIKAMSDFTEESDIHFNYCQARRNVYRDDFDPERYEIEKLVAIELIIEHEKREAVELQLKKIRKHRKKKRKEELLTLFPPYLVHRKDKGTRKKIVQEMSIWEGKALKDLKMAFIRTCLADKFFGCLMFDVECVVPDSGNLQRQKVLFTITEEDVYLLDKTNKQELALIRNGSIRSWKPQPQWSFVKFTYVGRGKKVMELDVYHEHVLLLVDHFVSMMNFLKQQKLAQQTDDVQRSIGPTGPRLRPVTDLPGPQDVDTSDVASMFVQPTARTFKSEYDQYYNLLWQKKLAQRTDDVQVYQKKVLTVTDNSLDNSVMSSMKDIKKEIFFERRSLPRFIPPPPIGESDGMSTDGSPADSQFEKHHLQESMDAKNIDDQCISASRLGKEGCDGAELANGAEIVFPEKRARPLSEFLIDVSCLQEVPCDFGSRDTRCIKLFKRKEDGKQIVGKFLESDDSGMSQKNFDREISSLAALDHPCVVIFVGYALPCALTQYQFAIFTEYACGGSLASAIQMSSSSSPDCRWFDSTARTIIVVGIVHGMMYIHSRGIIHRDLKPSNILLDGHHHPQLCDFGSSRAISMESTLTQAPQVTFYYAAPEFYDEEGQYDSKVDVYSFGIILYEIVTGKFALRHLNQFQIISYISRGKRPEIPGNVLPFTRSLIERCWSSDPSERPSFTDIYTELVDQDFRIFDDVDSKSAASYARSLYP